MKSQGNTMTSEAPDGSEVLIGRIESAEWLDSPSYAIGNALSLPTRIAGGGGQRLRNALHGTWLGHPLHPMLVTVPIGTWTLAFVLDRLETFGLNRNPRLAQASDVALAAGAVGAVAAALAGTADWQHVHGRDRRTGLVHALVNSTALGLNLLSLALRRRGRRSEGQLASAAGWGCMFVGAYLGGHLVYRRRIGVTQADQSPEPRAYAPALPLAELAEDRPRRVEVWDEKARQGIGVVLVRHRGQIHALGSRCSHTGGPLDEGWILGGGLVCPWHGSRYDLSTGRPLDGPSTCPQPCYRVRICEGMIEIRREPEPGDEAIRPEDVAAEAGEKGPAVPEGARKADEVLFEHHELLRRLFERIEATPRHDPERRDLMRTLADELELHENVEDEIFYPAVRPVSEDVPLAHAEHRQLADLLAVTVRLDTGSPEFEEHLRVLHRAVDHHARSEETSMFEEAQRLGDRRLRELGHALESRFDELRASRFQKTWRALKLSLLERA